MDHREPRDVDEVARVILITVRMHRASLSRVNLLDEIGELVVVSVIDEEVASHIHSEIEDDVVNDIVELGVRLAIGRD